MGVHGLTTYLRENKHILSRTIQFTKSYLKNGAEHVPLVVDAWSFIYELGKCADLPWVYGGEYTRFAQLIEQVVEAWIDVGLEVHFVFDGPYTALKFPTLASRITQNHIQTGLLFFRTSAAARTSPRFLRETAMLPPLAYSVCVDTLRRLSIQSIIPKRDEDNQSEGCTARRIPLYLHFADQEGDPYAVTLAGRLEAYIAGRDSDFVVLNTVGYRGYVPLDDMLWTLTTTSSAPWDADGSVCESASVAGEVDANSSWGEGEVGEDGFQIVRKGKGMKKRAAKLDQNLKVGRGILPPRGPDPIADVDSSAEKGAEGQLTLSFAVYDPSTLAAHLGIPVSLLPLVGALLGNDFTGAGVDELAPPPATMAEIKTKAKGNLQRLFFERGLTHTQRITRVAGTLKRILAAAFDASAGGSTGAMGRRRERTQIGSVMELIDAAVTALLVRPLDMFATGEREAVVERIAEATLQYAIPRMEDADLGQNEEEGLRWVSDVCPLHMPETCPLFASLSGLVDLRLALLDEGAAGDKAKPCEHEAQMLLENVRKRYVQAYRLGQLDPHILDTVRTGTMWPRTFLEDPDKESVQRSVGRPVRMWTYAVLDAGIGLPSGPEPEPEEKEGEGADEDEDEDELIDVVEEDEIEDDDVRPQDPLARLRGVLKELDGSDDRDDTGDILPQHPTSSILGTPGNERQKIIMEYVRRGTRLVPEEIFVPRLSDMFQDVSLEQHAPPQLWADNTRKTVLLRALASDSQRIARVPDESLISVLAVRWVVRSMHLRAQENPGVKERIAEQWTRTEARAVLASFSEPYLSLEVEEGTNTSVQIVERNIQLVAQILVALDAIEQLSQALLLSPAVESPARRFSGTRCHALLSGRIALPAGEPSEEIWHACLDGLEDAFAPPRQKKDRKSKGRAAAAAPVRRTEKGKVQGVGLGGLFRLLGDMEA